MMEINGKYASAKIFTDDIGTSALAQILELLDQPFMKGSHLRFMPDVHAGKGCTIGTTMRIGDRICPNLIGVDIGCGMLVVELPERIEDFSRLDDIIHNRIPAGMTVREEAIADYPLEDLHCYDDLNCPDYLLRSIGTLGGGNHFIEIDEANDGRHLLVIHTGSRNLGKQVCEIYMHIAHDDMQYGQKAFDTASKELIQSLKEAGKQQEINSSLAEMRQEYLEKYAGLNKDLATITGKDMENYLHDMRICQDYAVKNREAIADVILHEYFGISLDDVAHWQCIHNYIDTDALILRKGSISAKRDEMVIVPLNMRDGCIIGKGKGNPDWNYSGPHGAGRKMSRSDARANLSVDSFADSMKGIYSSTVNASTLDEAPDAYKDASDIISNIEDTIEVIEVVKPVYNFKASE